MAVFLSTAFGLTLCPSVGYAESHQSALTVKVPFEFVVGSRTLPAGTYKFETVTGASVVTDQASVLVLRNTEGRAYHAVVTDIARGDARLGSSVVFTQYRGQHFLSEVWESGRAVGLRLHNSANVTELARAEETQMVTLIPSTN